MNTQEIKQLLHQREPYLMVSEVLDLNKNRIKTKKIHSGEEFYLKGHFPNAPVVPGAMLQEICTQSAGLLITKYHSPVENYHSQKTKGWALGVLNKVEYAKFLNITKGQSDIEAEVDLIEKQENLFKFKAKIKQDNKVKAKFLFNLVNISDAYLTS